MSEKEIFNYSGPTYLTNVNWTNPDDQKSVAACLVRGVYVSELDRQKHRKGSELALAPAWWKAFHFELKHDIVDDASNDNEPTIFGAVLTLADHRRRAPRCVVAFRGTTTKKSTAFFTDVKLDLAIGWNALHQTRRFQKALKAVEAAVHDFGHQNVWITGHSLGAAIALLVGKTMVKKKGIHLEAFLFNPPFPAPSMRRIIWSRRVRAAVTVVVNSATAGVAGALGRYEDAPFQAWSKWHPRLYVNRGDHLCWAYIDYFELRRPTESAGGRRAKIERVAAQHSLGSLFLGAINAEWGEATHLIPSAELTVNKGPIGPHGGAHGIYQWWVKRDSVHHFQTQKYTFPDKA